MNKKLLGRGAWLLAGLCFTIAYLWMTVITKDDSRVALIVGGACAIMPLIIAGGLLFRPSDSFKSPFRPMWQHVPLWRKPRFIVSTDKKGKHVKSRPKGGHHP